MKRKMSALQRKYFGKRHKTVRAIYRRKGRVVMAKRYARSRRTVSGARGFGSKMGGIIPPVLGGVADSFLNGMRIPGTNIGVPNGVGAAAVGWFMKDNITRNIGLYQIGQSLPGMIGGFGGSSTGPTGGIKSGWL